MNKQEEVRQALKKVMRPNQYYSSEDLQDLTEYDSREIYKAVQTWKNNGTLRKRQQENSRDIEYRLVR